MAPIFFFHRLDMQITFISALSSSLGLALRISMQIRGVSIKCRLWPSFQQHQASDSIQFVASVIVGGRRGLGRRLGRVRSAQSRRPNRSNPAVFTFAWSCLRCLIDIEINCDNWWAGKDQVFSFYRPVVMATLASKGRTKKTIQTIFCFLFLDRRLSPVGPLFSCIQIPVFGGGGGGAAQAGSS